MRDKVLPPISPNVKWGLSSPTNEIRINNWEFLILFGQELVVPVKKGVINFRIKNHFYYYSIYEPELLDELNFTSVRIRFDGGDLSKVHLFSVEEDEYLETINPSLRADRTKYKRSIQSRNALNLHHDKLKKIKESTKAKLNKYKEIVEKNKMTEIPIELINRATDDKEVIDQAELDYWNETMDTSRILEETDKQKLTKKQVKEKVKEKRAKSAGDKYNYLHKQN